MLTDRDLYKIKLRKNVVLNPKDGYITPFFPRIKYRTIVHLKILKRNVFIRNGYKKYNKNAKSQVLTFGEYFV